MERGGKSQLNKQHANCSGMSMAELLVAICTLTAVFAVTMRFSMNVVATRELVRRDIELAGVRWYLRDSLDCEQTFNITNTTKLPLSCADYPRGKEIDLRARPAIGSKVGAKMKDVFEKTDWKLRSYCEDNALVVEYAPRNPKGIDKNRGFVDISPTDVALPREVRPFTSAPLSSLPGTLGFAYVGDRFHAEGAEQCPATSSLGSLVALGRFAAQVVLNSAPPPNDALDAGAKWSNQVNTSGVDSSLSGLAKDLGSTNAAKSIAEARTYANKWIRDIAVDALKRGATKAAVQVGQDVLSGRGINVGRAGQAFTKGSVGSAADALGAREILEGTSDLDSGLTVAAKIPLQMAVVMTDVNRQIDERIQMATGILSSGLSQGLPNNRLAQAAIKAAWDMDGFLKNDMPAEFGRLVDATVGDSLRRAIGSQIDNVKAGLDAKFTKIENDLKAGNMEQGLLTKALQTLVQHRADVLRQVDGLRGTSNAFVEQIINQQIAKFRDQMNAITVDPSQGSEAMMKKLLSDLQQAQANTRATAEDLINRIKASDVSKLDPEKGIVPVLPEPPWMDVFDGTSKFCRHLFSPVPERDYAENENSCPLVANGAYPIFAGRKGESPVCCREVSSEGAEEARCAANEYSLLGGAECSGPGESIVGQQVTRQQVLPAFQSKGFATALGVKLMPTLGTTLTNPPVPKPHQHVVMPGAKLASMLTVSQVYASSGAHLGGFLRASGSEMSQDGRWGGGTSLCYFANKRFSRSDDWTGPSARHKVQVRSLCCPMMGISGK